MSRIHLVRHGQTDWNLERRIQGQTNSQLTALGRQQAQAIAEELKALSFAGAYASSSDRARDTAQYIVAHRGLDLTLWDELREISLGPWEGQLYDDIKAADEEGHGHFWEQPHLFQREGAETFAQLQQRAIDAIGRIAAAHPQQDVLVVSHGAFIKSVLCHVEGRHLSKFWHPPRMANCCHSIIRQTGPEQFVIDQYAGLTSW